MSTKIEQIDEDRIRVNGKLCFRNSDGQWICTSDELTPNEQKSLYSFLTSGDKEEK